MLVKFIIYIKCRMVELKPNYSLTLEGHRLYRQSNQNSRLIHVVHEKRGKLTRASESRLSLVLVLIGSKSGAKFQATSAA